MRHRSLQNGRDAGSIGRRRQYTQRGSDCAKPAHCINGAEIAETPDAARAGWPFDPPAQRAAGLHGSLGYRVTLDADCADHGLKRDADHADQGMETRRGSRGSGTWKPKTRITRIRTWKRDADRADQDLETRCGSRGSGLGNETRIARIRNLETRRGSRGSGFGNETRIRNEMRITRITNRTAKLDRTRISRITTWTGRGFRGPRLKRTANFADHDLSRLVS